MSPKISKSLSLEPINVTFYGKRDFGGVIRDFEMKGFSWIIWVNPKCNYKYPYMKDDWDSQHRREGGNVTTKVDIEVMWPQAKKCWQPQEAGSSQR